MTTLHVPTSDPAEGLVFLRREVLSAGYTDRIIRHQLRAGEWVRVRHGAFAVASVWQGLSAKEQHAQLVRAVVRQAHADVVASHTSAATILGAPDFGVDLDIVHVTRRDQRAGRTVAGVRQHRGLLLDADVVVHDGIVCTSGTRTAIDVTTVLDAEPALGVVCSLLHAGHTTPESIDARYEQMQRHPGTLKARLVLGLASPLVESIGEARTLYLLWRHHLPMPMLQHVITDERGRELARLDFAWPEHKVYLEFDGKVKYTDLLQPGETITDVVLREKRREEMIHERTGWRCIRITWADLEHPERTVARIRAALGPASFAA